MIPPSHSYGAAGGPGLFTTVPHDVVERLFKEKGDGDARAANALRVLGAYPARMEGVAYPGRLMGPEPDGQHDGKSFCFFLGGPVVIVAWSAS